MQRVYLSLRKRSRLLRYPRFTVFLFLLFPSKPLLYHSLNNFCKKDFLFSLTIRGIGFAKLRPILATIAGAWDIATFAVCSECLFFVFMYELYSRSPPGSVVFVGIFNLFIFVVFTLFRGLPYCARARRVV